MRTVVLLVLAGVVLSLRGRLKQEPDGASSDFSYENGGTDWPGKCQNGKHQSPVNIIEGINTEHNKFDSIDFEYHMKSDFAAKLSKFVFTGKSLEMDLDIGTLNYNHKDGTIENYRASKMTLHYPSEHLVTLNGQTPRRDLEMQIEHQLTKTSSQDTTNRVIKVKRLVVSILFRDNSILESGDKMFESLGITAAGLGPEGFRKLKKDEELAHENADTGRGNEPHGFSIESLLGLRNILNFDHHIFQYYGSNTVPPCEENTSWIVFALPRSLSKDQLDIIKTQLETKRNSVQGEENINVEASWFYGNNRAATVYNDNPQNGKIQSMPFGISKIFGLPFPKGP